MDQLHDLYHQLDQFIRTSFLLNSDLDIIPLSENTSFLIQQNNIAINNQIYKQIYNLKSNFNIQIISDNTLLLLIKPDFYSAWNRRKQWITQMDLPLMTYELNFCTLLQSKYPKKAIIWSHR